ncbi:hypothetical protein N9E91_03185 [Alphaproteobacteria bacterium]|nr:hypothetical protein [Alphaproteobacteria bacterium]
MRAFRRRENIFAFLPLNMLGLLRLALLIFSRLSGKLGMAVFVFVALVKVPEQGIQVAFLLGVTNIIATTLALCSLLGVVNDHKSDVSAENVTLATARQKFSSRLIGIALIGLVSAAFMMMAGKSNFVFDSKILLTFILISWFFNQLFMVHAFAFLIGKDHWKPLLLVQLCPFLIFVSMTIFIYVGLPAAQLYVYGVFLCSVIQIGIVLFMFSPREIFASLKRTGEMKLGIFSHQYFKFLKLTLTATLPFCLFYFSDEIILLIFVQDNTNFSMGIVFGKLFFAVVVNFVFNAFYFFLQNIKDRKSIPRGIESFIFIVVLSLLVSFVPLVASDLQLLPRNVFFVENRVLYFITFLSKALMTVSYVFVLFNAMVGAKPFQPKVIWGYFAMVVMLILSVDSPLLFSTISLVFVLFYIGCLYVSLLKSHPGSDEIGRIGMVG